ncbi:MULTISPECIES: hypothetical protein [Methylobacteriaceae]|uniref:hypothetical protein n=1 Tax=Methylobacteriaceae TaxID=119045 RepID=UPI00116A9939|nr:MULTISPECIES: hypothetical protein [Methylobacteriaceae]GEL44431.1 hypothetical protein MEX01_50220 [Methylorubrum extorquens]
MLSLLLLAIGLATVLVTVAAAASRPAPPLPSPVEAIPLAALGLQWRRLRDVNTRRGPRTLWAGEGDPVEYQCAWKVAREAMSAVGYSWSVLEGSVTGTGTLEPCCWEDASLGDGPILRALDQVSEALVENAASREREEDARRRSDELRAELDGSVRREALADLRTSLRDLAWAWPRRKRELAESLLREPEDYGGAPQARVAQLARELVHEVFYAIDTVRRRAASDPLHAWLERAESEEIRRLALVGVLHVTAQDEDCASVRNSRGWGRSHTHLGHVLAEEKSLNVIQASQALGALHRHRKQLPGWLQGKLFGEAA